MQASVASEALLLSKGDRKAAESEDFGKTMLAQTLHRKLPGHSALKTVKDAAPTGAGEPGVSLLCCCQWTACVWAVAHVS